MTARSTFKALVVLQILLTASDVALGAEKLLLPIQPLHGRAGAYDSRWHARVSAFNSDVASIQVSPLLIQCPPFECTLDDIIEPGEYQDLELVGEPSDPPTGWFLYAEPDATSLHLSLRVFHGNALGAAVPVVREADVFASTFHILGVPVRPDVRTSLRIYDFDDTPGASSEAVVRIIDSDWAGGREIGNVRVPLVSRYPYPPIAHISIDPFISAAGSIGGPLRIEVSPVGVEQLWAFVSTTSNIDQHVLVLTPDKPRK